MAPRIGFSMAELRAMQPTACASDVRLGWKKDDESIVGLLFHDGTWLNVPVSGMREIELLTMQLLAHVEQMQRRAPEHEMLLP